MFWRKNKKSKKVLISINDLLVGGAQKLVLNHLEFFNKSGYETHLVILMEFPNRSNLINFIPNGVHVHRINLLSAFNVLGLLRLLYVLIITRPHVIFSHLFLSNTIIRIISLIFPFRIFTVEHNTYKNKNKKDIFFDRILSFRSEKIIAVSEEVREFTIKQQKLNRNKCIVIDNGINLKPFNFYKEVFSKKDARKKLNIEDKTKVFLSVARLTPQKNLPLLINSFVELYNKQKDLLVYILGEGGQFNILKSIIEKNNASSFIKLMGNIEDPKPFYRSADFFISTSYIEGMSIAFLEALAFGIPIIATETGGTRVLIKDDYNGFIIPKQDVENVCKTVQKAINSEYKKFSLQASLTAEKFDIDITNKKYEKLFN